MNVSLTPHLEAFVKGKLASGRYHSASEVIREALRLLDEQSRLRELRLDQLRQDIAVGIAQADRGEVIDGAKVFAKLRARDRKGPVRAK